MPADDITATPDARLNSEQIASEVTPPRTTHPETAAQQLSGAGSPWFWLGMLVLLSLAVRYMPVPNQETAYSAAVVALALHVLGVVQFAAHATRRPLTAGQWIIAFVACLVLWAASQFLLRPVLYEILSKQPAARDPWSLWSIVGSINYTLRPLFLLGATVCGGSLVARLINSRNMLGPVCAIIALIDVWGVLFGGIVSQMMARAPSVASKVMADLPVVGQASGAAEKFVIPVLQVGPGDYLFLGLLFAALHRNHMDWRGALRWTVPLMILALLSVAFTGFHLPGLLFIGLGVAIPNWKFFEYTREEWFALLYAGIFVIILTIILYFVIMSQLPELPSAANAVRAK